MSEFADRLALSLPAGTSVPEPLERAFTWMEAQGWSVTDSSGDLYLTPYPGTAQMGVIFATGSTLDGWFEPGEPGADRLVPFVDLDGAGSTGVLWFDDAGEVRMGALGGEGHVGLLADSPLDFLRLVAIGYDEIGQFIDGEPDDDDSVDAHGAFREWVAAEFAVAVPAQWSFADPDPFNAWVNDLKGVEYMSFD